MGSPTMKGALYTAQHTAETHITPDILCDMAIARRIFCVAELILKAPWGTHPLLNARLATFEPGLFKQTA